MGCLDRGVEIKTPEQIDVMRRAGLVVGRTLELLRGAVRPGVTHRASSTRSPRTASARAGATPSFQGYHGFPASICASVNDEVVHGIPGDRVLAEGDVVSIDCGAIVDGWHGDAAITVAVGEVPAEVTELMRVTEEAMWRGHRGGAPRRPGHRHLPRRREARPRRQAPTASSRTTPGTASASQMHQPPNVPNYGRAGRGPKLVRGPGAGGGADGHAGHATRPTCSTTTGPWSPPTAAWAAHFEHTFTLTPTAPGC